mmetsp:Transcript_12302/g.20669  ORF Transcript_12302/g.20669 Transcript_12302/m.20669 type:complete len:84 (-) Transcript_12302:301-552(-)
MQAMCWLEAQDSDARATLPTSTLADTPVADLVDQRLQSIDEDNPVDVEPIQKPVEVVPPLVTAFNRFCTADALNNIFPFDTIR